VLVVSGEKWNFC